MKDHALRIFRENPPRALPDPNSLEEWERQRCFYLEKIKEALNLPPDSMKEKCPLRARFVKEDLEFPEYTIKHLIYESLPNFWVTANLYIPKSIDLPTSGIVHFAGHSGEGKHTNYYMPTVCGLARKGHVVLAVDEAGGGERAYTGQRYDVYQYLVGNSPGGIQIWDAVRAIDYLSSIPEWVDPLRIGATGNSGGGEMTFYLAAVDERVACAVPTHYVSDYAGLFDKDVYSLDNYIVNIFRYADMRHVLARIAPRACVICATTEDFVSIHGTRRTVDWARRIYALYGNEDRLQLLEMSGTHGEYTREFREQIYGAFNRFFSTGQNDTEPDMPLVDYAKLWCGMPDASTATLSSLAYEESLELPPAQAVLENTSQLAVFQENLRSKLYDEILGFSMFMLDPCNLASQVVQRKEADSFLEEKIVFQSELDVPLKGILRYPKNFDAAPGIVRVLDFAPEETEDDTEYLVDAGYAVLSIKVRRALPDLSYRGDPEYFGFTAGALMGKSLFAQKVWDVLRAVDYLLTRTDVVSPNKVRIIAKGTCEALYGLFAAALDNRINATALEDCLVTYKASRPSGWYAWPYALYLPRILKYADVSHIISLITPRSLLLAKGRDTMNHILSADAVCQEFEFGTRAFILSGCEDRLSIVDTGDHDAYLKFFMQNP